MKLSRRDRSLIYSLHPERLPASAVRVTYTFGLGGIAVLSAAITVVTGVALMLYYLPTPADAHASVVLIEDVASFGSVVRGLHYWAAQLMVVAVTLHMARVVFTGGYRPPREANWLVGLGLLVVTLVWDFTGYVLRWDDGAQWALVIGANLFREIPVVGEAIYRALVGDVQVGPSALLRFYAWHVCGLTLVGSAGIVYHLWRLRRDGGISRPSRRALPASPTGSPASAATAPDSSPRELVSRDELITLELIAAGLVGAALIVVALFAPAPVGTAASLASEPAVVQAPWVFLWVQSLLRFLPALLAGIVTPLVCLGALALVPWLDRRGPGRGIWFARERWKPQVLVLALAVAFITLSIQELLQ